MHTTLSPRPLDLHRLSRRALLATAAGALVISAAAGLRAPTAAAQMPSMGGGMGAPMGAPMSGGGMGFAPMSMGSFAPSMSFSPMGFPAVSSPAMPSVSAPSSTTSIYSMPVTASVITANPSPTYAPASISVDRTYSYQGQYCSDASGGQVWVSAGGATDGLTCGSGSTSSDSGGTSNSGGTSYGSSYAP
jgi:hypothetical protein